MTQRTLPARHRTAPAPSGTPSPPVELGAGRGLPRLPRGYVETRAVRLLAAQPLPPIVLLQAPRGYGKTATASWLLRQADDPRQEHVWVNLPSGEIDESELWETIGRRLRDASLEDADWDALDRSLARRRRRLVVVVDGLDRVDEDADERLADLVGSHESIHLVAMARRYRPLREAATMLDGVILQIAELRLTAPDVVTMATRLGHDLLPDAAADLTTRLHGWPALLRLALADPTFDTAGNVVIDQPSIERYVRLRLHDLPTQELRTTLSKIAVAEDVTPELALRLVGQRQLDALRQQAASDGGSGVGSLATMSLAGPVRQAAASILAEDDPEDYRRTNALVSRWYASHSQPAAALRHAMAAEDWDTVADMLREHWSLLLSDHPELARSAISSMPPEIVESDARFLVARDFILSLFAEDRARAAYEAGLLVPDGVARARSGRRLSLRQVLTLHSNGIYDAAHTLVESRDVGGAIDDSGWSPEVVQAMPGLLFDWAMAFLLGDPGVVATYAFTEAAAWAEHIGNDDVYRDAVAGAALSHVVIGHSGAALEWLDVLDRLPAAEKGSVADVLVQLARALVALNRLDDAAPDLDDLVIPEELADLEAIRVRLRSSALVRAGRSREAVRMLESYRVRPPESGSASLAEHVLVATLVEAYLASSQVERARRLLLDIDPDVRSHAVSWALVDFQSGEYERVLTAAPGDALVPRQTLELALLRAAASLRLQHRGAAIDAFQTAVSTALQTKMLRPFALIPPADLAELSDGDGQVAQLLGHLGDIQPLLAEPQDGSGLSPRELQVLEVVATGASFAAVASRLYVSPNTVKSQMRDIYRKLAVRGREHAVERARELGLLRR